MGPNATSVLGHLWAWASESDPSLDVSGLGQVAQSLPHKPAKGDA